MTYSIYSIFVLKKKKKTNKERFLLTVSSVPSNNCNFVLSALCVYQSDPPHIQVSATSVPCAISE